jgi:hypothetical protein
MGEGGRARREGERERERGGEGERGRGREGERERGRDRGEHWFKICIAMWGRRSTNSRYLGQMLEISQWSRRKASTREISFFLLSFLPSSSSLQSKY